MSKIKKQSHFKHKQISTVFKLIIQKKIVIVHCVEEETQKMFTKKRLIPLAIILLVGIGWIFLRNGGNNDLTIFAVEKQNAVKEIFETGKIIRGERFSLGFHIPGRLSAMNVSTGEEVAKGQLLAVLESPDLYLSIQEAREGVAIAQAELDRLLEGSTQEEIEIYQATLERVKVAGESLDNRLEEAKDVLAETEKTTEANLKQGIEEALSTAKTATEIARSTMLEVADLHFKHFFSSTHKNLKLLDAKVRANATLLGGGDTGRWNVESIANLKGGIWGKLRETYEEITFEEAEELLAETETALIRTMEALDAIPISSVLSDTEKALIQQEKQTINQQYATVKSASESLKVLKIETETTVANANRQVQAAEDSIFLNQKELREAETRLAQISAPTREYDQIIAEAKLRQAQTAVRRLESSSTNNRIFAPVSGTIAKVILKQGEVAQPGMTVLEILPEESFQIEMFVYEADIGNLEIGDSAKFEIVALPKKEFEGTIIEIEPASTIINGVVHYRVLINPETELPIWIFPDMTVDIRIISILKEDILLIPDSAITHKNGKDYVRIMGENGKIEEREIVAGIRSSGRMTEITEGLEEKEKILID